MTKSTGFFKAIIHIFLVLFLTSCLGETGQPIPAPAVSTTTTPNNACSQAYWSPLSEDSFQIQLSGYPPDLTVKADVFELDLFETSVDEISILHEAGKKVLCYMNAGAWEEYRPDASDFPDEIIGNAYDGWEGEYWLDIGRYELFSHLIVARFDLASKKGCDGIDTDNINGFQQDTGFHITAQNQLSYNIWLSEQAHKRGLSIAMKNDNTQVAQLVNHFDFAVIEGCAIYDECSDFLPFTAQGKAVFQIEYTDTWSSLNDFCPESISNGFTAVFKNRGLDAWLNTCSNSSE